MDEDDEIMVWQTKLNEYKQKLHEIIKEPQNIRKDEKTRQQLEGLFEEYFPIFQNILKPYFTQLANDISSDYSMVCH